MITILLFLLFISIFFPQPIKALFDTSVSIIGKILSPLATGFVKIIEVVLEKSIQIIGSIFNGLLKIIVMVFDRIRF
ncbi:hypothetical protein SAMN05216503_0218 [Polaribacter sp. KT25b]|uniref:hypothetical protein n=1 Tax=Polaribacter sp. KT25b TaxID=1855336 RepID=UPI00087DD93E|nr:hypothetical protein [Polaribacter sp. KT25b]SDR66925.1 hypothetical protein SAMN05216503_0218 [Polaribacter sp. KT25b]